MDMAVASLFKHKIRFERYGVGYGGGYGNVIYYSSKIENLESIGARSLYDLCLNQLQSFFISSPEHEVLMVSYCDRAVSGVRRPSCVVRRPLFTLCTL